MVQCQSLLLLSTCSYLLSTCYAFVPSNHPALIAPHNQHESSRLLIRDSSYLKPDTTLYATKQPVKKKTFQRGKTPSKLNARAKTPSKQVAKKKPFQRAKTPSKLNARAKTPSKQAAKKKPFQKAKTPLKRNARAKTPSKQIVKKKPFQRAKTPSKQNTRAKTRSKQIVKKKSFQRGKTPSRPLFPQTSVGPPLLLKVVAVGGAFAVTLAAALLISLSYVNPKSSIGDFSSKSPTYVLKKNQIGRRKPSKAPKEYIDFNIPQQETQ